LAVELPVMLTVGVDARLIVPMPPSLAGEVIVELPATYITQSGIENA
jgi:hypothetical protein